MNRESPVIEVTHRCQSPTLIRPAPSLQHRPNPHRLSRINISEN
jgi:hypothetical protein